MNSKNKEKTFIQCGITHIGKKPQEIQGGPPPPTPGHLQGPEMRLRFKQRARNTHILAGPFKLWPCHLCFILNLQCSLTNCQSCVKYLFREPGYFSVWHEVSVFFFFHQGITGDISTSCLNSLGAETCLQDTVVPARSVTAGQQLGAAPPFHHVGLWGSIQIMGLSHLVRLKDP